MMWFVAIVSVVQNERTAMECGKAVGWVTLSWPYVFLVMISHGTISAIRYLLGYP